MDIGTPECESPASILGISEALFEKEWVVRRSSRMKGHFPDYYAVLKDISTSIKLDVDDQLLWSLNEKRLEAKNRPYQNVNPHVMEMLYGLNKKGVKIGLVSNCSPEESESLFSCPLASFLDVIVLSFGEGVSKPQPEIYELACKRLDIKPSDAIFNGDGGAKELAGAEKAGLKPFRATWFYNRQPYDSFPCLETPIEVLSLFETLACDLTR